ncbi:MAG: hypothetical protein ABF289_08715, partial [Clostridiales bacterium]
YGLNLFINNDKITKIFGELKINIIYIDNYIYFILLYFLISIIFLISSNFVFRYRYGFLIRE